MQTLEAEQQQRLSQDKQLPDFRSGDILEVTTVRRHLRQGLGFRG